MNLLNINNILSVISKGLNITNKIVPICKDYKPLFNNIYKLFNQNKSDKIEEKKEPLKSSSKNNPQFFI